MYIYIILNHVDFAEGLRDDWAKIGNGLGAEGKESKECTIYNTSHGVSRFSC